MVLFYNTWSLTSHIPIQLKRSSPSLCPLLPRTRTYHPSSKHARQLLRPHRIHHPNHAHDKRSHGNAKAGKQHKFHADILLLARTSSPQICLLASVLVRADYGATAFALEAVLVGAGSFAGTVAGAGVCAIVAGFERGETGWEAPWEGYV
jgi:hypothetical protein